MSNDRYERIRQALAMGPTPGPWEVIYGVEVFTPLGARNAAGVEAAANDGWHVADCDTGVSYTVEGKEEIPYGEKKANAALIAACDPDTIRELLTELDALAAENARLQAEVKMLRTDLMESDEIRETLGQILTRTAAALKGDPPAGVWHSWHDLPELAAAIRERLGEKV